MPEAARPGGMMSIRSGSLRKRCASRSIGGGIVAENINVWRTFGR